MYERIRFAVRLRGAGPAFITCDICIGRHRTDWDDLIRSEEEPAHPGTTWHNMAQPGSAWDDLKRHGATWNLLGRPGTDSAYGVDDLFKTETAVSRQLKNESKRAEHSTMICAIYSIARSLFATLERPGSTICKI